MRITIFGATGNIGQRILNEALQRGHTVTAVSRNPNRPKDLPKPVHFQIGDIYNQEDVIRLCRDQDLVISATRPPAGDEHELADMTCAILAALAETGTRLLLMGGAGSLVVPNSGGTLVVDDERFVQSPWRAIALACCEQLAICQKHPQVNWSYLSPAARLVEGERSNNFRLGKDELLIDNNGDSKISMEDLAVAMLNEAENPQHHQQRFTLAY